MARSATVLSFLALGLAGWAAYTAHEGPRGDRPAADADALTALEARFVALEARVAAAPAGAPAPIALPVGPGTAAGTPDGALAAAPRSDAAPAPLEARVAELTQRLAAVEEKAKEAAAAPAFRRFERAFAGPQNVLGTLDEATSQLGLTASQRAEWERTVADAQRELDDVRALRDDQGKSWRDHNEEALKGLTEGGRIDLGKMLALRSRKVPGRDETYGQVEARVRTDAKRRLRDALGADQQKRFDDAVVDPLLGGLGGGPVSFAITSFGDAPKPSDK